MRSNNGLSLYSYIVISYHNIFSFHALEKVLLCFESIIAAVAVENRQTQAVIIMMMTFYYYYFIIIIIE